MPTLEQDVKYAETTIMKAMNQNGPYSHNIIGLVLSDLASKHGNKEANKLIDEYRLMKLYGFRKVK